MMGETTVPLLEMYKVPLRVIGDDYKDDVDWAVETMETTSMPVALILKKGVFS